MSWHFRDVSPEDVDLNDQPDTRSDQERYDAFFGTGAWDEDTPSVTDNTRYILNGRPRSFLECPDCGASLQPNARLDALRCPGCGFTQDIDLESV